MYRKMLSRWINKTVENAYWYPNGIGITPATANTIVYYTGKTRIVATTLSQWS
jgi:hypothetical protein